MSEIRCLQCGNIPQPDDRFCRKCGSILPSIPTGSALSQEQQLEQEMRAVSLDAVQPPSKPDLAQLTGLKRKIQLESKVRNGANWFFWIAGLSIVNTIIYWFGSGWNFLIGLGATQIIDAFLSGLSSALGPGWDLIILLGRALDLMIAGMFIVFGLLGRKGHRAPIIAGMVIYALDGIILLLFRAYLNAGFHLLALGGLWGGLRAMAELDK